MAFNAKLTLLRGAQREDVAVAAGTNISGGGDDAIEINIDATNMTRGEAVILLETAKQHILTGPWPIL